MEIKTCEQYVLAELADAKKKAEVGEATEKLVAWVRSHAHISTSFEDPDYYCISFDSVYMYSWGSEFETLRKLLDLELPTSEPKKDADAEEGVL